MSSMGISRGETAFSTRLRTFTGSFFITATPASSLDSLSREETSHSIRSNCARRRPVNSRRFSSGSSLSCSRSAIISMEVRGVFNW